MNSIRKIKKLTARYPIVIEIHIPNATSIKELTHVRNKLKQEFGDGVICFMFPVPDESEIPVFKKPELSPKEKQEFVEAFTKEGYKGKLSLVDSNLTTIVRQKTFIHSVFALSKKQHKELSDRLEKHLIGINPKK